MASIRPHPLFWFQRPYNVSLFLRSLAQMHDRLINMHHFLSVHASVSLSLDPEKNRISESIAVRKPFQNPECIIIICIMHSIFVLSHVRGLTPTSSCVFFEPTCAHAWWALMHRFLSVCPCVTRQKLLEKNSYLGKFIMLMNLMISRSCVKVIG